jgi:hypothetical protein
MLIAGRLDGAMNPHRIVRRIAVGAVLALGVLALPAALGEPGHH